MIVEYHTVAVRVSIAAEKPEDVTAALEDIRKEVQRVAQRRVLIRRYRLKVLYAYRAYTERVNA